MKRKAPHRPLRRRFYNGQFTYDHEADAAFIYLGSAISKGGSARTLAVPGNRNVYLDFAKDGRLLGVELLGHDLLPPALAKKTRRR